MRPLRLLLVHERFAPDSGGGGEAVVLRTAQGLIARGHGVRVICAGDPAIAAHEGVPTERIRLPRHAFALALPRLVAAAREADLVQAYNYHAALPALAAARLAGRPVVATMLGLFGAAWRRMRRPPSGALWQGMERLIAARRYDRTVFLSEPSRRLGLALGADPARSVVIPPGLDRAAIRDLPKEDRLVVFAGQFDARKGAHHVLNVARAVPEARFAMVGWGEAAGQLAAAAPANLDVREARGGAAYWDALGAASVFLFPSYAETFGIVVAEAMASGCAVVSSIDTIDFAGVRVPPGDEAGMTAAVAGLLRDPARTAALGAENRRRAEAFTWERHVDALIGLYAEAIAGRAERG